MNIYLRKASPGDCRLFFEWANDMAVRQNAVHSGQIEWDSHVAWFSNKVSSPGTLLFIMIADDIPVGQIRFDQEGDEWFIDYSVDQQYRGRKLGREIVTRGLSQMPPGSKIAALVKPSNIASAKVFESLHFIKSGQVCQNNISLLKFSYTV